MIRPQKRTYYLSPSNKILSTIFDIIEEIHLRLSSLIYVREDRITKLMGRIAHNVKSN